MAGDLHTHSNFSDGSTPIEQLPRLAAAAGLSALAVADHDTLYSVQWAQAHPEVQGVRMIPATELTAYDYEREHRVHLLCYYPQIGPELTAHCAVMAERRNAACYQSARELEAIYPQFRLEDALVYAEQAGVLYKAAIMRQLCELGLADAIYGTVYRELFGLRPVRGRVLHNPTYEDVPTVLNTAKQSKAVVVLAHPSVYKSMPLVRELARDGLIDGVEIDHPRNTPEDKQELTELAQTYGLIVTGGSDFHGLHAGKPNPVGGCQTSPTQIDRIAQLAQARQAGTI